MRARQWLPDISIHRELRPPGRSIGFAMTRSVQVASFRRVTPAIIASAQLALSTDVPDVNKSEMALLLKRAAPVLGIDGTTYHVLDILLGLSRADDWKGDARPLVAISNAKLAEYTMRSERTVMRCVRKLVELGIAAYRDSSTGRRFIQRSADGEIACGFGIDFTPARVRAPELQAMVADYHSRLQRELSARRDVARLTRAMTDLDVAFPEHNGRFMIEIRRILGNPADIVDRADQMQSAYADAITLVSKDASPAMTCKGDISDTPYINTNLGSESVISNNTDTDAASRESKPSQVQSQTRQKESELHVLSSVPLQLLSSACRQAQEMTGLAIRNWSDLRNGGETLRRMIGLPERLWLTGVSKVGSHAAAAIVATVLEKTLRQPHLITKPAGYFHAMISRAVRGKLRLDRTLFGLLQTPAVV